MPAPTVEDATRFLTDRTNVAMGQHSNSTMVVMRPAATIGALQAMGATLEQARELVAEAAHALGGAARVERRRTESLGTGRYGGYYDEDVIVVPRSALRD